MISIIFPDQFKIILVCIKMDAFIVFIEEFNFSLIAEINYDCSFCTCRDNDIAAIAEFIARYLSFKPYDINLV